MKTTNPIKKIVEAGCATAGRPRRGFVCWTLAGFGLGVVAATAYLLLGGEYFMFIPRWAAIVFYPGFFVGNTAYKLGLNQEASKVVGVIFVGLAYAALVALARFGWFALKHRRELATVAEYKQGRRSERA